MANITDSSIDTDIDACIANSETNDALVSKESAKYKFGSITFDDPMMIPRQFWELFDRYKIRKELPPSMKYKPEVFAKTYYGSTDLWWFVLMSNGMTRHSEFNMDWAYSCDRDIVIILESVLEATQPAINRTVELKDITLYPVKI